MKRRPAIIAALFLLGCGSTSNAVRTALHGDLTTLKRDIAAERHRGELDRHTVEHLARAVAGREIRSATGQTAVLKIRKLRACSGPLRSVLRDRASRPDDAGAEATLVLYERHELDSEGLVERYAEASSGAWRAVAGRAAAGSRHAALRRRLMQDPDERTRRASFLAALESSDSADLAEALESARLDPDALSRSLAIRVVGTIGGARAVQGLDDLWARANEPMRAAIVEAWGSPKSFASGGRERLIRTAEAMNGMPSVAAASALSRQGGPEASLGNAVLARAIREGTDAERRVALELAPFSDSDVRNAAVQAAASSDLEVQTAALARLALNERSKSAAIAHLQVLAKRKDYVAVQARAGLARAGDHSIRGQLLAQLNSRDPSQRRAAAFSLLDLDEFADAATALADDDPEVRTDVACSLLSSSVLDKTSARR